MKALFIGEGRHDIGDPSPNAYDSRPAHGTIPTLARRICPVIGSESVALAWSEIRRFNLSAQKRGYTAKIAAAALLAVRKFGCAATIIVADRDGDSDRQSGLEKGVDSARRIFPQHVIVWGLAIQSVEAWTLGVPEHLAEELGVDVKLVQQQNPRGVDVESLSEGSGKPEHRPKQLLDRIAQLKHRHDCTEFLQAVAERTDVAALSRASNQGFAPFAERLQSTFGSVA